MESLVILLSSVSWLRKSLTTMQNIPTAFLGWEGPSGGLIR
jgi:hypothetical protein